MVDIAVVEITATEFDVSWEQLGLGPTPTVLQLPSPGRTAAERRMVTAAARRSLHERGVDETVLAHRLRYLAQPDPCLELRGGWAHGVRALATGSGVLAVRRGDSVTITPAGPPPVAVLGVLPAVGPGSGYACTVPTAVLAAALRSTVPRSALIARDVPTADAGVLARMLDRVGGRAQITADGRRPDDVVTVFDGPSGRYLLTRTVADDGTEWTTVAPADVRAIRHRVEGLLTVTVG